MKQRPFHSNLSFGWSLALCISLVLLSACGSKQTKSLPLTQTDVAALTGVWAMEGAHPDRSRATTEDIQPPLTLVAEFQVSGDTQFSSPVTVDHELLLVEGSRKLHALEMNGGAQRWEIPLAGSYLSPAISNGIAYVRAESGEDGYLVAVSASNGNQLWQYKFASVGSANNNIGGHVTSPVIVDGLVLVGAAQTVEAIDAGSGKPRWRSQLKDAISSSLAVAGDMAYASDLTTLYALDIYSGGERWQRELGHIPPMFAPIVVDEHVFVSSNNTIHAFSRGTGEPRWNRTFGDQPLIPAAGADEQIYVKTINELFALHTSNGEIVWRYATVNYVSMPALSKTHVYIVTRADGGSQLRMLARSDGKEVWRSENLALNNSSPVIAGPFVFVRTTTGGVLGFQAKKE